MVAQHMVRKCRAALARGCGVARDRSGTSDQRRGIAVADAAARFLAPKDNSAHPAPGNEV